MYRYTVTGVEALWMKDQNGLPIDAYVKMWESILHARLSNADDRFGRKDEMTKIILDRTKIRGTGRQSIT